MRSAVAFDPVAHVYTVRGRRIWSVTNALSVVTNFDRVPPDVLEAARIFGHHVHKAVHLHTLGTLHEQSLDPKIATRLRQWKQFLFDTKYQPLASEQIVIDRDERYCGTLDNRGRWHGRGRETSALVDLKSGVVPKCVGPQTAGYQQACDGEKPRLRFVLQLRDHDYRLIACNDATDWSYFLSCLNVFKMSQKGNPYAEKYLKQGSARVTGAAEFDTDTEDRSEADFRRNRYTSGSAASPRQ